MGELAIPRPAQLAFAHFILDGKSTVDAYRMAGYSGDAHAAYTLRGRLDALIAREAAKRGFSRAGVAAGLVALNAIPVNVPADGVSVDQKLRILALEAKIHHEEAPVGPITPFKIGSFVEAEVVQGDETNAESDPTSPDLHPE